MELGALHGVWLNGWPGFGSLLAGGVEVADLSGQEFAVEERERVCGGRCAVPAEKLRDAHEARSQVVEVRKQGKRRRGGGGGGGG